MIIASAENVSGTKEEHRAGVDARSVAKWVKVA
jgi:hypothetical protein